MSDLPANRHMSVIGVGLPEPFDYGPLFDEFERSGFNRECGPLGRLTVEVYKTARPMFGFVSYPSVNALGFLLQRPLRGA